MPVLMANNKKEIRNKRGTHPNSLANLNPASEGEVRNPSGRPKGSPNRSSILRYWVELETKFGNLNKQGEKIFEQLNTNLRITVEDEIALALISEARKGNVSAIREINDTLYGKQTEKHELTGADGKPIKQKIIVHYVDGEL